MTTSKKKGSRASARSKKGDQPPAGGGELEAIIRPANLTTVAPPVINSVQPSQIGLGVTTRVTVTGSNLPFSVTAYSVANTSGQPVLGTGVQLVGGSPPSSVVIDIFTSPQLAPGAYELLVQGAGGSASFPIQIGVPVFLQPPSITSLDPNLIYVYQVQASSLIVNGRNLPITLSGYRVQHSSGQPATGISLSLVVPSATSAVLQLTIDPAGTPSDYYQVVVTTDAGSATGTFQIINFAKGKETKETKETKEKEKEKEKEYKEKEKEYKEKEYKEKERIKEKDFEGFAGFSPQEQTAHRPAPAESPEEREENGQSFIPPEQRPEVGGRALSKKKKERS